jgi:uncharacterized protein YoaH (UPF0181 family)
MAQAKKGDNPKVLSVVLYDQEHKALERIMALMSVNGSRPTKGDAIRTVIQMIDKQLTAAKEQTK